MVPTRLLLEAFIQALAESGEPPEPGAPDHWLIEPDDWTQFLGDPQIITVTCKDVNDLTVTSYSGPVDIFNIGQFDTPVQDGWADGVLTLQCFGLDAGGGAYLIVDQGTGTPSGFASGSWVYP